MTGSFPPLPARILKVYVRGLHGVQACIPSTRSQQHIALSRLCPWILLPLWEQWGKRTFRAQGSGWGASDCPGPAHRSIGSPVPLNTSPNMFCSKQDFPRVVETTVVLELGREHWKFGWFESFECTHWETLTIGFVNNGIIGAQGVPVKWAIH